MKYTVTLTNQAIKDIDEIFQYVSDILHEKEIAIKLINLLQKNILSLDEMPARYKVYEIEPWKSRELHIMPVKKYLVFYLVDNKTKTVTVIRVIYGSRDYEKLL